MKFLKTLFLFLSLIFLNGCLQSTAMLGPGVTLVTTGNVAQAGFQFAANNAIKNETGKNTFEFLQHAVDSRSKEENFKKKFQDVVEKKFQSTRQKLNLN